MRLRRSDPSKPGLRRVRRGRGFSFIDAHGQVVDAQTRERVLALVIPPAWREVWVCPWPKGHIQAIGTDDAGRRQYLYHPDWHTSRERRKHVHVLELARRLPAARVETARRLKVPGFGRDRVVAVALRLLDAGLFRTGGEQYEQEHGSHGVATLLREHVTTSGDLLCFEFPAKSGVNREARMRDPLLAKAVAALKRGRGPTQRLLQFHDADGWHDLGSADINREFQALVGSDYTVKDLRTWAATLLAAAAFADHDDADHTESTKARQDVERAVMDLVAQHLGNTPAVARRSYVDARVIDEYAAGRTIARALTRASAADRDRLRRGDLADVKDRQAFERAVLRLLR